MLPTTSTRAFRSQFGHWIAELLLVFLGAYAAFWLTKFQQHQEDARRRDQILESLERNTRETVTGSEEQGAKQDQRVAEFRRALAADEMPALRPLTFSTDYSPNDAATLLQAGGLDLLDIRTIVALRKAETTLRGGLSQLTHLEKMSDQLIAPNLDQDPSFFYDPATKKLRKRFENYPDALQQEADFFHHLGQAESELLQQLKAERKRPW